MSVKKSRTTTRRQKPTITDTDSKALQENAQRTSVTEEAGRGEAVKNVSARASRKVAAEKEAAAGQESGGKGATSSQEPSEEPRTLKVIPSRRVWPD